MAINETLLQMFIIAAQYFTESSDPGDHELLTSVLLSSSDLP